MKRIAAATALGRWPLTAALTASLFVACSSTEPGEAGPDATASDTTTASEDATAGHDATAPGEDAEPAGRDADVAGVDAEPGQPDATSGNPDATSGNPDATPGRDAQPHDTGAVTPDAGVRDAGARDAGSGPGPARQIGTISNVQANVACGAGGTPTGATCTSMVVRCPGIVDITAIVAVGRPSGSSRGTIVAYQGSGGMDFYQQNIAQYVQNGFTTVQVRYNAVWQNTSAGILDAACRPATVLQWVFENVHNQSRTAAFCAVGHSGGSGQVAYLLSHYGMESLLDYASLGAGPPFARIDCGCAPQTCPGPHPLCPALPDAPVDLPAGMDVPENTTTCRDPSPLPADLAKWAADSVVSSNGDFDYPDTVVDFYDCTNQPNGTTGGAYFYSNAITSARSVTCFTAADGCVNEGVGTAGNTVIFNDMLARCVPRH